MPQKRPSGALKPQTPRSQYVWYAWSSQVTTNTTMVAAASATGWGQCLRRKATGLNTIRTMKSFQ